MFRGMKGLRADGMAGCWRSLAHIACYSGKFAMFRTSITWLIWLCSEPVIQSKSHLYEPLVPIGG